MIAQEAYLALLQGSPLEMLAAPGHAFHTMRVCADNTHERRRKGATTKMGKGGTTPTGNHHSTVNPALPTLRNHEAETPARPPRTAFHSDNPKGPQSETVNIVHNGRRKAVDIEIVDGSSLRTDSDACHGPASQREWRGARREARAEGSREATQG